MRALGVDLPGLSPKTIEKRPYPPGQHGQARKKPTEYALRLREKQKIRMGYGLTEAQLRRLVKEAKASKSPTGEKLVELVERRLDNVVFRAGFARTIPAARQLVRHGHVQVGGRRVAVPSYRVSRGEVVSLAERSHAHPDVVPALADRTELRDPVARRRHEGSDRERLGAPRRELRPLRAERAARRRVLLAAPLKARKRNQA